MKLRKIIKDHFNQEAKKDIRHISAVQKQILAKIKEEKEVEEELEQDFQPSRPFWTFKFPLAFASIVAVILMVSVIGNNTVAAKSPILEALINLRNALQQELSQLLSDDPAYRDKDTQRYQQAQNEWCSVSARSPEERELAVEAIRDFLDRPDANVEYECIVRKPNGGEDSELETYLVNFDRFTVDMNTNLVVEMVPEEGTWGTNKDGSRWFSPAKQYNYDATYTIEEAKQLARDFVSKHEKAIGKISLDNYDLKSGTKEDQPGQVAYFFIWQGEKEVRKLDEPEKTCSLDIDKELTDSFDENGVPCMTVSEQEYIPQLILTFTQGGDLVNFSNKLN